MVCVDVAFEGSIVFMKNWYDVSHFINNHCAFAIANRIDVIESLIRNIEKNIESLGNIEAMLSNIEAEVIS